MSRNHYTVLASRVVRIIDALQATGVNIRQLCLADGIDLSLLEDTGARCSVDMVRRIWELAVDETGNQALGLVAASKFRPTGLDVLEYSMMSSRTLSAALARVVLYSRIVDDATHYRCNNLAEGCCVHFDFSIGQQAARRQSFEFVMLSAVNFCRWMVGYDLQPLRVQFSHPPPNDLQPYLEAFRCPIEFDADINSVLLSYADLNAPLMTHNSELSKLHERCAAEQIAELNRSETTARVRTLIIHHLPGGEPGREKIARALCLSVRTLQRRLHDEGTSYRQLLDDTRRELAAQYLASGKMMLAEATYLLGFSDQSNFSRAAKRWFDQSPREIRTRLLQSQQPTSDPVPPLADTAWLPPLSVATAVG